MARTSRTRLARADQVAVGDLLPVGGRSLVVTASEPYSDFYWVIECNQQDLINPPPISRFNRDVLELRLVLEYQARINVQERDSGPTDHVPRG